jgi:acetyl esterase/lipase
MLPFVSCIIGADFYPDAEQLMTDMLRVAAALSTLFALAASASPAVGNGDQAFEFDGWAGPSIPVRLFVPDSVDTDTPIVVVMHGASREAERYYNDWRTEARRLGFIVVVPYFSREDFPRSAHYNLGHLFEPETGIPRPAESWTFAAIEPLFDEVVERLGGEQTQYTLFGHSAGSQFLHRFLYYVPDARVKTAIAANAGWYTMPDFGVRFPYGLAESGLSEDVLAGYFSRDLVVLLGGADTLREDDDLRKTPEAELQGRHRFDRGHTFYRVARAKAEALGVDFNWRLQEVPGAGHSNAAMTPAAALLVDQP